MGGPAEARPSDRGRARGHPWAAPRPWLLALALPLLTLGGSQSPAEVGAVPPRADPAQGLDVWSQTVAAAREEGVLTLSGPRGLDELQRVITEGFKGAYGIDVQYFRLGPESGARSARD